MERDSVDEVLDHLATQWHAADLEGRRLLWHLQAVGKYVERWTERGLSGFGPLSSTTYKALVTLRSAGQSHTLSPTDLGRALMMTSGAVTGLLDRLEAAGLVERAPDPEDRRGVIVTLTAAGVELSDRAQTGYADVERRLLAPLTGTDREQLTSLLRKLLLEYEASDPAGSLRAKHRNRI
jgi:DNA-binding MarR family transcriptional regulator